MQDKPSRLTTTLDFEQDGKQVGYVRLPHSVHRSAYGWLPVPIACIRNGDGPTVLLMSGTHGDEYEGQVTLSKLINRLEPEDVQGRVIIFPMANFPAAKDGLRTSPIDELNLNRVYPGDPDGTPTLMIAHYVESVLLKLADYYMDLHSGGSSLHYLPSAVAGVEDDPDLRQEQQDLMRKFGAPHSFFFPGGHAGGTTSHAAKRQNVQGFGTEMGGTGTVTPDCLKQCEAGVERFLHAVGVKKTCEVPAAEAETRMLHAPNFDYFTYAMGEGLFEPVAELGDEVVSGDLAGYVHQPETPGAAPEPVHFTAAGLVICKRIPGRVMRGDCLFHLGTDF